MFVPIKSTQFNWLLFTKRHSNSIKLKNVTDFVVKAVKQIEILLVEAVFAGCGITVCWLELFLRNRLSKESLLKIILMLHKDVGLFQMWGCITLLRSWIAWPCHFLLTQQAIWICSICSCKVEVKLCMKCMVILLPLKRKLQLFITGLPRGIKSIDK